MTDEQLESNRFKIVKDYLKTGEILNLTGDLDICISSSQPGTYHVFFNKSEGQIINQSDLIHQYSISDTELEKISSLLDLNTIKKTYIQSKYISIRNKRVKENIIEFNPLDYENQC